MARDLRRDRSAGEFRIDCEDDVVPEKRIDEGRLPAATARSKERLVSHSLKRGETTHVLPTKATVKSSCSLILAMTFSRSSRSSGLNLVSSIAATGNKRGISWGPERIARAQTHGREQQSSPRP